MTLQRKLSIFAFVTLSFLSLYILGISSVFQQETAQLSTLIIIDVLLTIPLIYFLLIRKTTIPKLSIIPVTILGIILATYVIPENHQTYLNNFKNWVLPVVELFVFCFIIYKLRQGIKSRNQ